jgi:DNA-binding transcriptional regulator YdaS (Cro superfamily)
VSTITREVHFARRGNRKQAVDGAAKPQVEDTGRVPRVSRLMALAIRFDRLLREGVVANQSELARLCQVTQPRMTQIMNLLHLAPEIQEALLCGLQLAGRDSVTERHLRPIAGEVHWERQLKGWRELSGMRRLG